MRLIEGFFEVMVDGGGSVLGWDGGAAKNC